MLSFHLSISRICQSTQDIAGLNIFLLTINEEMRANKGKAISTTEVLFSVIYRLIRAAGKIILFFII